jgi:hypothetical protein
MIECMQGSFPCAAARGLWQLRMAWCPWDIGSSLTSTAACLHAAVGLATAALVLGFTDAELSVGLSLCSLTFDALLTPLCSLLTPRQAGRQAG